MWFLQRSNRLFVFISVRFLTANTPRQQDNQPAPPELSVSLLRLRQLTFVICNRSETNVRKISDTTSRPSRPMLSSCRSGLRKNIACCLPQIQMGLTRRLPFSAFRSAFSVSSTDRRTSPSRCVRISFSSILIAPEIAFSFSCATFFMACFPFF